MTTTSNTTAAPVMKWVGGKTKLLPELLARMPARFGRYYEPFCGGAALFFRVAPELAVLGDANADLIATYRAVADDVEGVIRLLLQHEYLHRDCGAGHFSIVRDAWNNHAPPFDTPISRAAAFVYLNRTCFNGLWRVNRAGAFNVSMGRYTNPLAGVSERLRAAAPVLARAELRAGDYRVTVAAARRGDFVYFDPPYDPVSPNASFTTYTVGAFGLEQQRELADTARALVARGCQVMLSNSDTPLIRKLYKGFKIDRVRCSRAINSNPAKRGEVDEVIVMGGYAVVNERCHGSRKRARS